MVPQAATPPPFLNFCEFFVVDDGGVDADKVPGEKIYWKNIE